MYAWTPNASFVSQGTDLAQQDLDDVGKDSYHHVSAATSDNLDSLMG
jgi:hypothetical protein